MKGAETKQAGTSQVVKDISGAWIEKQPTKKGKKKMAEKVTIELEKDNALEIECKYE